MHFLIAVSGFSKVGKDEFCKPLIEKFKAVQIGLADPAKRHMADLYGFTEEQLFGSLKNVGDIRYPKSYVKDLNMTPWENKLPEELVGILDSNKKYWTYEAWNMATSFNDRYPHIDLGIDNRG